MASNYDKLCPATDSDIVTPKTLFPFSPENVTEVVRKTTWSEAGPATSLLFTHGNTNFTFLDKEFNLLWGQLKEYLAVYKDLTCVMECVDSVLETMIKYIGEMDTWV